MRSRYPVFFHGDNMATDFTVAASGNPQLFRDVGFKDGAIRYAFDFSPWEEDNGAVTSVTWTVKSGSATVSADTLSSSVARALVTFGDAGGSLIQIKAVTAANGTYVAYLDVLAKDPNGGTNDYGLVV